MASPTSSGAERVCATCGRPAAPHEYFCHRCTTRLPDPSDPTDRTTTDARARAAAARPDVVGWPVLLTVVGVVLVVGGIIAGAVFAVVRLDPFAPDPDRPGEVVQHYFEAAQDDDCGKAVELEVDDFRSRTRCEGYATLLEGTEKTDGGVVRIEDELVVDADASVKVRLAPDDATFVRCTLDLRLDDVWLIEDSVCEEPTAAP